MTYFFELLLFAIIVVLIVVATKEKTGAYALCLAQKNPVHICEAYR